MSEKTTTTTNTEQFISRGIISHKSFAKGAKLKRLEPMISMCYRDLQLFFKLSQLQNIEQKSVAFGIDRSMFSRYIPINVNEELIENLGNQLLAYFDEVYHFIPENFIEQIFQRIHIERKINANGDKLPLLEVYKTLKDVKHYLEPLHIRQVAELVDMTGINLNKFNKIYSYGEIPSGYKHSTSFLFKSIVNNGRSDQKKYQYYNKSADNFISKSRTIRLWLALGLHYGVINRSKIHKEIEKISINDFAKFAKVRERIHEDILNNIQM